MRSTVSTAATYGTMTEVIERATKAQFAHLASSEHRAGAEGHSREFRMLRQVDDHGLTNLSADAIGSRARFLATLHLRAPNAEAETAALGMCWATDYADQLDRTTIEGLAEPWIQAFGPLARRAAA